MADEQMTLSEPSKITFGPDKFGVVLKVNPEGVPNGTTAVVDVETDESGNFVGIGVMCDPLSVSYYSELRPDVRIFLSNINLIGHNLKFDARQLHSWGVTIHPSHLVQDTMLKSYVRNSTKESHGLKDLAKEYLGMEWPTYKEMVGERREKTTLDKQEVEKVAAYCGDDCVATFRLNAYFDKMMSPTQKGYYNMIELPTMQLLFAMEMRGVTVDVEYLKALKEEFSGEAATLLLDLRTLVADRNYSIKCKKSCPKKAHTHEFNPGSPIQVKEALNTFGYQLVNADKAALEPYRSDEFVNLLMEYRKINKVVGTFLENWLSLPSMPKIHTTFSQVSLDEQSGDWKGIRTGRLSSKEPNLQQISKAGDSDEETTGKALRSGFIPSAGKDLVVFDFDQMQYRILAHYTKEPVLLNAFRNGKDVHEETARILLGKDTITKKERSLGKCLNFGAVFGSMPEKIAEIAKCSLEEAEKFYKLYWVRLPGVARWIFRTKNLAHVHKSVKTIFGRVIPLPDIDSRNMYERMHAERTAVNYIIQGSEADIIKLGMLQTTAKGYMPLLQVHDELHFETDPKDTEKAMAEIKGVLDNIVKLDVPLTANGGFGANWFLAK
jgi:DNA polymerase-1